MQSIFDAGSKGFHDMQKQLLSIMDRHKLEIKIIEPRFYFLQKIK